MSIKTPASKNELVEIITAARKRWNAQLLRVQPDMMEQKGVVGDWSVKDLVAHITWSENEMVGLMETRKLVGSELWNLTTDERNQAVYLQNRDRPLEDVLGEAEEICARLLNLIDGLEDADLHDPSRFVNMPSDWMPWRIIAGNTYLHYDDHASDLESWLEVNP